MKFLRVESIKCGDDDLSPQYRIWWNLDVRHETFVEVNSNIDINTIIDMIDNIQDMFNKGLLNHDELIRSLK